MTSEFNNHSPKISRQFLMFELVQSFFGQDFPVRNRPFGVGFQWWELILRACNRCQTWKQNKEVNKQPFITWI